ncbi:MAG: hypothetical protein HY720_02765 [Planctomycetes bacterium]|nr:hypothetical protein [Planctomycetota bacterium]
MPTRRRVARKPPPVTLAHRRTRTVYGTFMELAFLALHRQRLLTEQRSAACRTAEIDRTMADIERQTAFLLRCAETGDPALLARLAERSRPLKLPGFREEEMRY